MLARPALECVTSTSAVRIESMAASTEIAEIEAREILDSLENRTIEVDVRRRGSALGLAAVPAGGKS